jgi:endoglucanase
MKGARVETLTLIKELSEAVGPSGREEPIRRYLRDRWAPHADEMRTDALGNFIALQRGSGPSPEGGEPRPAIMAAAHMDEIALLVSGFEEEFLRVDRIGGVDRRALLGLRVVVHGREELPGIIGTRPPHVLKGKERKKTVPWEKLFVDVGLPQARVKERVRVGDPVSIERPLIELKNKRVAGKAMDNRVSVAALTLTLEMLSRREHAWDFYAVATVQEEVGLKGAMTGAYGVNPQIAIAIDATFAQQADDGDVGAFELNKGPAVGLGPNFHPQVVERLRGAADAREIPYQLEPLPGSSGTDAWIIQVSREGIPTGLLSVPIRYMHQPVETLALRDVERTGRLLAAFVADLELDYRPRWEDEL